MQEDGRPQSAAPRLGEYTGSPPATLPGDAVQAATGSAAAALQQPPQPGSDSHAAASSNGGLDAQAVHGLFRDGALPHSPPRDGPWQAQLQLGSPTAPEGAEGPVPPGGDAVVSPTAGTASPRPDYAQQSSTSSGTSGGAADQGGFGSPVNASDDPAAQRGDNAAPLAPELDSTGPSARQVPADPVAHHALAGAPPGTSSAQRQDAHAAGTASHPPGEAHAPGGASGGSGALQRPDEADVSTPRRAQAVASFGERHAPGAPEGTMQQQEAAASASLPSVQQAGQLTIEMGGEEAALQQQGVPPSPGGTVPPAADGDAAWTSAAHRWAVLSATRNPPATVPTLSF